MSIDEITNITATGREFACAVSGVHFKMGDITSEGSREFEGLWGTSTVCQGLMIPVSYTDEFPIEMLGWGERLVERYKELEGRYFPGVVPQYEYEEPGYDPDDLTEDQIAAIRLIKALQDYKKVIQEEGVRFADAWEEASPETIELTIGHVVDEVGWTYGMSGARYPFGDSIRDYVEKEPEWADRFIALLQKVVDGADPASLN